MPRERKAVETALVKKGFRKQEGDHHYFIFYSSDNKKSMAKTKTSHTPKMKTLSDNLLSKMAGQCHLTKGEFLNLVDCSLSAEDFETKLKKQGKV